MKRTLRTLAVMAVLALVAAVDFVRDTAVATYTAAKRAATFVFDLGMSLVATEPQPASTPQFRCLASIDPVPPMARDSALATHQPPGEPL